jgi:uncharacterized protein YjbI with pentapeptide repeats
MLVIILRQLLTGFLILVSPCIQTISPTAIRYNPAMEKRARRTFRLYMGAVGVGVLVVVLLVWWVPSALYGYVDNEKDRATAEASTRTGIIAGLVGLVALGSLVISARTLMETQHANRREHWLTERGQAIEQLGSDKAPVRLAGLYALEAMAQVNVEDDRQWVVDVFCAYLRMPYDVLPEEAASNGPAGPLPLDSRSTQGSRSPANHQDLVVRREILRVLARHMRPMTGPDGAEEPVTGPDRAEELVTGPDGAEDPVTGPDGAEELVTGPDGAEDPVTGPDGPEKSVTGRDGAEEVGSKDQLTVPEAPGVRRLPSASAVLRRRWSRWRAHASRSTKELQPPSSVDFWANLDIDLRNAVLEDLDFRECHARTVRFDGATFWGPALFNGAVLNDVSFRGVRFRAAGDFSKATLAHSDNDGWFQGATFCASANYQEATFSSTPDFSKAKFKNLALFDNANFQDKGVWFDDTEFHDRVSFANIKQGGTSAQFGGAKFFGDVSFADSSWVRYHFNEAEVLNLLQKPHFIWPTGWKVKKDPANPNRGTLIPR